MRQVFLQLKVVKYILSLFSDIFRDLKLIRHEIFCRFRRKIAKLLWESRRWPTRLESRWPDGCPCLFTIPFASYHNRSDWAAKYRGNSAASDNKVSARGNFCSRKFLNVTCRLEAKIAQLVSFI